LLLAALVVLCGAGAAGWWWVEHYGWTTGAAAVDKSGSQPRPQNANLGFAAPDAQAASDAKSAPA
jgi:hypothetical protein